MLSILLWLHLAAVALGGTAIFGLPTIGRRIAGATPETRVVLFGIANAISTLGRGAIVVLVVTGIAMIWQGSGPLGLWFWLKMLLVVGLIVNVVMAGMNAKRAQAGDMAAAQLAPKFGAIGLGVFLAVLLAAVYAFN